MRTTQGVEVKLPCQFDPRSVGWIYDLEWNMDKTTIYGIGVRNILEKTDSKTIWDCRLNVHNCGIVNGKTQLLPVKRISNC